MKELINYLYEEEENMEEKKYTVVGKVEIGTDEYRDLLTAKFEAENKADRYMREGWDKDKQINELNKQVEALKSKLNKCEQFIKKNSVNISEDGISIFMSLFGEE